jgi:hypothetical protein
MMPSEIKNDVSNSVKVIYISLIVYIASVYGVSLNGELPVFSWMTTLSLVVLVSASIFFLLSMYRASMEWIKSNWGI